ncbi:MAG: OmpA family protein [Sulfuricaulis sp.]
MAALDELHQIILEKNMKTVAKTVGALALVGCAVMNSQFAVAADSGWYGGLGIGRTKAKINDSKIESGLLGSGLTTTSMSDDDRDTGYKVFGGLKFNRNFALEAGYFDLGEFGFKATTIPAGTLNGNINLKGFNLDAVGILPLAEKFSAFGRIGGQYTQAEDSFTKTGAVAVTNPNPSKRALNYKAGLGVQYDLTESVGLRGEWERYRINDAVGSRGDVDMLSVGLVVAFGGSKPAPAAREEIPLPPPAAAAPVLDVVPVPVRTQQYCSILDIQFEINLSNIQREDKEKLGVVGTFLKKYPDTTAVIEGHTDNVGTAEDNMELSQRRAESVVSYLTNNLGIARSRLKAVGYGDTRPTADNDTEEGRRQNRRIDAVIACATDIEGLKPIPARITMAMEMEFDLNKADIRPQYRGELRKVAIFLKANPSVTATVEGHTGNLQANPELAMEISQRRAQNVVNYLVDNFGIARSRLSAEGFGQTRRFAYNTSLEGQQENRRVNIIINYTQ